MADTQNRSIILLIHYWMSKDYQFLCMDFGYSQPPRLALSKGLERAWEELAQWYAKQLKMRESKENYSLDVIKYGKDSLLIYDHRGEYLVEHHLNGVEAKVYDFLHKGPSYATLQKANLAQGKLLDEIINDLLERTLILKSEDCYISLALRPKDLLIENYFKSHLKKITASTDPVTIPRFPSNAGL